MPFSDIPTTLARLYDEIGIRLSFRIYNVPSTNTVYKRAANGRLYMTDAGTVFKKATALIVRNASQHARFAVPPKARLAIMLTHHFVDNRPRDVDNYNKLAIDAIAAALGFNDKQIDGLHNFRGEQDKTNPHCEVRLWILK